MTSSAMMERLAKAKVRADETVQDRENYQAYVADRLATGGWSTADAAAYRDDVAQIMRDGSADEKAAAREFWRDEAAWAKSSSGINQRIRDSLKAEEKEAA